MPASPVPTRWPSRPTAPPPRPRRGAAWRRSPAKPVRAADELHVDLVSALANGLFIQDRPGLGADAVRAVEARMLGLGDRRREIEHYANLGVLLDACNRHVEAQAALGHVISLTRAEGDRTSELVVLSNLGSSLHDVGKVAAALAPLREALRLKEHYPELRTSALFVQVQIGNMERALGHYAEALRWLEEGRAILDAYVPKVVGAAHIGLARLWLDLGQTARARQQLDTGAGDPLGPAAVPRPHPSAGRAIGPGAGAARRRRRSAGRRRAFIIDSTRYAVRAQAALLAGALQEPEPAYAGAMEVARESGRLHMMGVRIDALVWAARAATGVRPAGGGGDACARGAGPVARARARRPLHRRALARARSTAASTPPRPHDPRCRGDAGSRPRRRACPRSSAPLSAIAIRSTGSCWPGPRRARPTPEPPGDRHEEQVPPASPPSRSPARSCSRRRRARRSRRCCC